MLLKDLTYVKSPLVKDDEFVGAAHVELEGGHALGIDKYVREDGRIEFDIVMYSLEEEDYDARSPTIVIDYDLVPPVQAQCILHEWTAGDADVA